ncbi:MAG: DEAD/DEAH box helicase family protein [Candidatus Levybacteria bacterium]|nr:DEAD/DEAH box helicase family protein [Candidatus Levybacteria bacterium]
MLASQERTIHGFTGEAGKDGLLTPEQQQLRNHIQEETANTCIDYLDQRKEGDPFPMAAMATGFGKGNVIHRIIEKQMRRDRHSKVLLIAGTKTTLVEQSHEALEGYMESEDDDRLTSETTSIDENPLVDEKPFLYKTGELGDKNSNVHIATIQTVQSQIRRGLLKPDDYFCIVDEVHNMGTPLRKATVEKFKNAVGFTATAYRHSGVLRNPEDYGFKIVKSLPLPEAQNLGFLPPLIGMQVDTSGLVKEVPMTMNGKIDYVKLERLLKESPNLRPCIADKVAGVISAEGKHYKTVIAVNFVWEAEELARLLKAKGIKVGVAVNQQAARQIHSEEIPALDSIERYKLPEKDERSLQVIVSPYILGEGFDAPATEALVWASPTDSELRYTQYTGRLARNAEGKAYGTILDFLYQTNQYNWSYNMGMWMKENVKQLNNGLLYLGREADINKLTQSSQVKSMGKQADIKPLSELQKEGLLEVQETDFSVDIDTLQEMFVGIRSKEALSLRQKALTLMWEEDPGLVLKRWNGKRLVDVVTNRQRFIDEMVKLGAVARRIDIKDVEVTDFAVNTISLKSAFEGNSSKLRSLADQALKAIREKNPELVAVRRSSKGFTVDVVTDRQRFIDEMIKLKVVLKQPVENIRETDFAINQVNLNETFINLGNEKMKHIIDAALQAVRERNPDLIAQRKNHTKTIVAVTDRDLFIKEMCKKGAYLQSQLEDVKSTDHLTSLNYISSTFNLRGNDGWGDLVEQSLNAIGKKYPDLVAKRRNGQKIVDALIDDVAWQLFVTEMIKRGVKLIVKGK